jgi:hypothetical protein
MRSCASVHVLAVVFNKLSPCVKVHVCHHISAMLVLLSVWAFSPYIRD